MASISRRGVVERNRLVTDNYKLIFWAYDRAIRMYPNLPRWFPDRSKEDWCQVLAEGLLRAAELYDENFRVNGNPVKFSTYACATLTRIVGRDVCKVIRRARLAKIPTPLEDKDEALITPRYERDSCVLENLCRREEAESVIGLIDGLESEVDRNMLYEWMGGATLKSIGSRHGFSRERVRQRLNQTKNWIRQTVSARSGSMEVRTIR